MPKPRIARLELDPDTRRREKEALRRKTSMDTRTPMAEVARGLSLALAAQHPASRA